jgi:pimeloyl-ACP methyl ester carboxylesterase
VTLSGWLVTAPRPNGSWVLLFHGVADNRLGVIGQSEFLLRAGYSVIMMDSRAHGASDGDMATYGWLERNDTRAVIDALEARLKEKASVLAPSSTTTTRSSGAARGASSGPFTSPASTASSTSSPPHIFALGESMGAGIALQSAAVEPRIEGVVAEAPFANLREASYDYAALRRSPFVGRTILRPFSWTLLYHGEKLTGLPVAEVSPEKAVTMRPFAVLLVCDQNDDELPCRHTKAIYDAAIGPKQFWMAPGAFHTAALGIDPTEFERRVLDFFANIAAGARVQ